MTQPPSAPSGPTVRVPGIGPVRRQWLVVGGAAVVVIVGGAYWMRRRNAGEPGYDPATGSVTGPDGYVNPVPGAEGGSDPVSDDPQLITNNAQWGSAAIARLVEAGWDAQYASTTIGKYLSGVSLTGDEANAVRAAIAFLGWPPENPPPIRLTGPAPVTPTPPRPGTPNVDPPRAPTPAPPRRYVIVQKFTTKNPPWDSTLSGIGGRTGRSVAQLADWNNISNPNKIGVGQRIYVDPPGKKYNGTKRIN